MKKSLAFSKLLCYDVKNNLKGRLYDERNGKQFRTQRRRTQALVIIAIRMVTRGTSCFCAVTV